MRYRVFRRRPRTSASHHHPIALAVSVLMGLLLPQAAAALPFDPVPSSFQRWLNGATPATPALPVTFRDLGACVDNTQALSPYRVPAYTCLRGLVALRADSRRQCRLDRLTYVPSMERLRLWPVRGCGSSDVIPHSIVLRNRTALPPLRSN